MTNELKYWMDYFEKSEKEMLPENFTLIKAHVRRMKSKNLREHTITNHLMTLTQFAKWCKVPFGVLTENDMLDYFDYLDMCTYAPRFTVNKPKRGCEKKYSDGTKYAKLATIKAFLRNINPEATRAITIKPSSTRKLPEDLLTKEDVEALIDNCENSRDRALISTLYESGMRKGELFSIRIKHVQFDEAGTVISIPDTKTTKTGARRIRVIFATGYLQTWLQDHPCKNDREHIVFCSLVDPHPRLTDAGLRDQMTKIARKAGIKKRVNPHSFRHARATHLAQHLTEQQMKKYLGWTEGSNMARVYVHLSGKDIDDAILKMYGMEVDERKEDLVLKTQKCPRCGQIQDARNEACTKCWLSFRPDSIEKTELELLREEIEKLKAEKQDMKDAYHETVYENEQEKQYIEEKIADQHYQITELRKILDSLTGDIFALPKENDKKSLKDVDR